MAISNKMHQNIIRGGREVHSWMCFVACAFDRNNKQNLMEKSNETHGFMNCGWTLISVHLGENFPAVDQNSQCVKRWMLIFMIISFFENASLWSLLSRLDLHHFTHVLKMVPRANPTLHAYSFFLMYFLWLLTFRSLTHNSNVHTSIKTDSSFTRLPVQIPKLLSFINIKYIFHTLCAVDSTGG